MNSLSSQNQFDVIICGAGPSGLTLSCYLSKAGYSVAIFEQAQFPRHQIGESLLPFSRKIFQEIGFEEKLDISSFVKKYGACFYSEKSKTEKVFSFKNSLNPKYDFIYHVPRDEFDHLLLKHAIECGVHVLQPCKVDSVEKSFHKVTVNNSFTANLLVRACGIPYSQYHPENYIVNNPEDNKTALYTYFHYHTDNIPIPHADSKEYRLGDILINLFYEEKELCWAWAIPLSKTLMSVGYVLPSHCYAKYRSNNLKLSEIGKILLNKNERLKKLLNDETPIEPYHLKFNFQRVSKNIAFDRELYIGDTAGFIDPVFSSGVHLGLNSARMAFQTIKKLGNSSNYSRNDLLDYEKQYQKLFWIYYKFVKYFYQKNLVENFFLAIPPDIVNEEIAKCFTSILSGDVETPNKIVNSLSHNRLEINSNIIKIFNS